MLLISAVLAAALAGDDPQPLEIQSDSDCPSAQAVRVQLQLLMPDVHGGLVTIQRAGEQVELFLYSEQQSGPLRRRLPEHPGCEQMARLAAAVIATWQATVQRAPARPEPAAAPAPPIVPAQRPPRVFYDLSTSVVGALSGTQLAIAEQLDLRLSFGARRFGVRLSALLAAPHSLLIGRGRAEWTRWPLRLLPSVVLLRRRFVVELSGGVGLALVDVAGQGFERNQRSFAFDVGLGGGLRTGWRFARVWPFLGLEAFGWLVPQLVRGTYTDTTLATALPRLDLLFSIGVAVDDWRISGAL